MLANAQIANLTLIPRLVFAGGASGANQEGKKSKVQDEETADEELGPQVTVRRPDSSEVQIGVRATGEYCGYWFALCC